jgi:AcrR family transcriptional regulator
MESSRIRRFHHEPVQDRGYRTRQKVLNAARRVLVRRGYQAARVEEITRLAQVGYGTFYKYFRNKQDVLEAVMEEVYVQLQDAGFPSRVEAAHLEDQIRCGITNYLKAYQKNREILLALQPASLMSPRIRKFLADIREEEVKWMVRELENLSTQGWKIGGNPEVFSLAMLRTVETVAQEWITERRHLKLEELTETLCDIWFRVILPSRPAEDRKAL